MIDRLFVSGTERAPDLPKQIRGATKVHTGSFNCRTQVYPFDVLHDYVRLAIRHFDRIEDADNIGMINSGQRVYFMAKLIDHPTILERIFKEQLDDDRARN